MAAVTLPPPAKPLISPTRPAAPARPGVSPARGRVPEPPSESRDPDALRFRVWERFCEGWRVPEIASDEGIPERTTRRWIASMRDEVYADLPDMRATHFAAAVDGLRALLAESWDAFHAERDLDLALQAQREIVRLLGLHQAIPDAPTTPETSPTSFPATSATSAPHTALSAGTNGRAPAPPTDNPATSATRSTSSSGVTAPTAAAVLPASSPPPAQRPCSMVVNQADILSVGAHGRAPAGVPVAPIPIPATSATSATPPPRASTPPSPAGAGTPSPSQSGHGGARRRDGNRRDKAAIPAKTATLAARRRGKQCGPILLPKQRE